MEHKSVILNALTIGSDSAYQSGNVPIGEEINENINEENEEINSFNFVTESDDSVKDGETSKTVTFAEDTGEFVQSRSATETIKINLDLLVSSTDQSHSDYLDENETQQNGVDGLSSQGIESFQDAELDSTDTLNKVEEENSMMHQSELDQEESTVPEQLLVNLLLRLDGSEKFTIKENPEKGQSPENYYKDVSIGVEPRIFQVLDGHKEFKVQNVDESQLALDRETQNAKLDMPPVPRAPGSLSGGVSPSTDINNQDTIGPLDNPAFLRTLQYSVSHQQPVIQDELSLRSISIPQDPPDLDKGWAWVVLGAAFASSGLLGATIYASGVLMLTILKDMNTDITKASWVGSLFVCSLCLSGPFVEVPIRRFGTRVTVFCAGIVVSAGFVAASFATSISQLILSHGLIAGIGAGFIANPVSISVGQYFIKYRGIACGLVATGAGMGMLTGGTIFSILLDKYGLSGTYLIWSGVLLHTAVLGLLLRPSPEERLRTLERDIIVNEPQQAFNKQLYMYSGLNSLSGSVNHSMLSGIDKIVYGKRPADPKSSNKINNGGHETPLFTDDLRHHVPHSTHVISTNQVIPRSHAASPFQRYKCAQSLDLGDLQYTSQTDSTTITPTSNSPYTVPLISHNTLANSAPNSSLDERANILAVSNLTNIAPNMLSSTSKNTSVLDKIGHGKKFFGAKIFSNIIYGDHKIPIKKSIPQHVLFHSIHTNRSHPRSHGSSPSMRSKFNHNLGLGDRQYSSLSASPLATPKSNSPLTILPFNHDMLTGNVSSFPSHGSTDIVAEPDLTHLSFMPNSPPYSPASILASSKFHRHRLSETSISQYTFGSYNSLRFSLRGSLHHSRPGQLDSDSIISALVLQNRPRDGLSQRYPLGSRSISTFVGSVASIPVALAILKDDVARYETVSAVGVQEKGLKGVGIKVLDSMRLLRRTPFVIFLSVCFVWSLGESPVMIYLPSYAVSRGTSSMLASMLYTAMGTGSIVGRFLSGLTASDINIGPVILYAGCLGIAGLLVATSPLFTGTFVEQIMFSCLLGFYTGSLVPLSTLIAIEMLDIGELGNGFGFISVAQGIGSLIGPPVAGKIVTAIGYRNSFVFSGCILITGGIMALFITKFYKGTEDEVQVNHDQLEKSDLAKTSNTDKRHDDVVHGNERDEDNVSKITVSSFNIISEVKESHKVLQVDGTSVEGSRDVPKSHEEKLDTILEVPGK